MNPGILICIWILVIPIGIIEYRHHLSDFSDFISVPYKINDFQSPETL